MTETLDERIRSGLSRAVAPEVATFAERLAKEAGARAVLFYGSNLRTGELEGVLDFYVLMPGAAESGIWPLVSYHERQVGQAMLRAKVARMTLAKFAQAARGDLLDTTVWTRFSQPSVLVWCGDAEAEHDVAMAIADAIVTASRLACALGPAKGSESAFWIALFEATYGAEFRIETVSRAQSILELNRSHFDGLLTAALDAAGIGWSGDPDSLAPLIAPDERSRVLRWWRRRKRLGKAINLARLVRASFTFEGAARYAAWKIERHTGVVLEVTPWRERHPILAAPAAMLQVWRERRAGRHG